MSEVKGFRSQTYEPYGRAVPVQSCAQTADYLQLDPLDLAKLIEHHEGRLAGPSPEVASNTFNLSRNREQMQSVQAGDSLRTML